MVTSIVSSSKKAAAKWNKPISLLWIDGDHRYKYVKTDFIKWEKHLITGGIIALHDYNNEGRLFKPLNYVNKKEPGIDKLVKKKILESKRFEEIKTVDSIIYARKKRAAGTVEIIKNFLFSSFFFLYPTNDYLKLIGRFMDITGSYLKRFSPRTYHVLKKIINGGYGK